MKEKERIIKMANGSLNCFLWGGHVIDAHLNQWGEWIVDCIVYNPDYRDNVAISAPKPREWQYMVEDLGNGCCKMHRAHNDMREMTFPESLGFYDEDAPRSPYIDCQVEEYETDYSVF